MPLARKITLPLLVFYGLGTILGAGIYVLVGKVAGSAGMLAPLAFFVAAIVAGITALSYCQLVVLYPKSSGEAHYVSAAFGASWLTRVVGLLVVFTGVVSCATLANGFVGYLQSFVAIPSLVAIISVVVVMTLLALWGIAESLWAAAVITLVEIGGLALVIYYGGSHIESAQIEIQALVMPGSMSEVAMVLSGAFLAFYAFIGFEDMVNVVEEVKSPKQNMPRAIIIALLVSSTLYIIVAVIAVLGLPLETLVQSNAPLRTLVEVHSTELGTWISVISLFAIVNGVLTQIIMASRVLYGLSQQGHLPKYFGQVSERTRTPWLATLVISGLVLVFALALPLVTLASLTSFIVLSVFGLVNLSLVKVQRSESHQGDPFSTPAFPKLGALLCVCLLAFQVLSLS